ncbi:MAG: NAD-dependent epimerase/dehydratase family protein [Desulfobacula sp.]|uniref:NAD-dependent epimerase/dehydratase family protein n=1 Tax=Desulfobacula sp. TaxID=2593537 RepID=UPI0025BF2CA3|nr:NAD-dependent epimerase/dehydratase family protein [Desulfobacula sp.]MCD4723109.1 NAD-dependent epimerase/dehydratase family protein [Desulfobacula sp.]
MKTILVTGASGFIGQALCKVLSLKYKIIALDRRSCFSDQNTYVSVEANIEDEKALKNVCNTYLPDVVIHCAGLAHQKLTSKKDASLYENINSIAAEKLAAAAISANSDVYLIFLSSISVYGENQSKKMVREIDKCLPTSDYAESKLSAENRLKRLYAANLLKKLDILRLAPVYDAEWSINLEKRVFAPKKMFYLRFGSGEQKISALARKNLIEFIDFRMRHEIKQRFYNIINVSDERPYSFNEIIETFQKTKYQPKRKVINIPLYFVELPITFIALLLKNKSVWVHSFYNKLANDLVFDNKRMLDTGFKHKVSLRSIFIN